MPQVAAVTVAAKAPRGARCFAGWTGSWKAV